MATGLVDGVIEGVDFSDSRPGGATLVAAGKSFAVRYVPYGGYAKGLTAAEVADYRANGLGIALVWEQVAGRALQGAAAGIADAQTSQQAAAALGFPAGIPIYFAVDFDATAAQQAAIDEYLQGAASVIGLARVGVYGGYYVVARCQANSTATWFWQTYAWSGGQIRPGLHLYQYQNGVSLAGSDVDLCRAYQDDFGQWAAEAEMSFDRTIYPFGTRAAPVQRTWIVRKGTTLEGYDPLRPGEPVQTVTFDADSSAQADAEVWINWIPPTTPVPPIGGPFLRVTDGGYAGQLILEAAVELQPAPAVPSPTPPIATTPATLTSTTSPDGQTVTVTIKQGG